MSTVTTGTIAPTTVLNEGDDVSGNVTNLYLKQTSAGPQSQHPYSWKIPNPKAATFGAGAGVVGQPECASLMRRHFLALIPSLGQKFCWAVWPVFLKLPLIATIRT
jgi:hypothetical protein